MVSHFISKIVSKSRFQGQEVCLSWLNYLGISLVILICLI